MEEKKLLLYRPPLSREVFLGGVFLLLDESWIEQVRGFVSTMEREGFACMHRDVGGQGKIRLTLRYVSEPSVSPESMQIKDIPANGTIPDEVPPDTSALDEILPDTSVPDEIPPDTPVLDETPLDGALLLTDSPQAAMDWKRRGGVCIGCSCGNEYFEGAWLVTDSLDWLDAAVLQENLLRAQGKPVIAACTQRLILREISKEDIDRLYEISQQEGMEYAMEDGRRENCFERTRMKAYIEHVYRLWGYGLWSVWTRKGSLIGCCGLNGSELQYMLDEKWQGRGYGLEMCRAVLSYAAEKTDLNKIWVRVHPDNQQSLRLAEKLGFIKEELDFKLTDGMIYLYNAL